jgi:CRP/FNR family transcriptional regulator
MDRVPAFRTAVFRHLGTRASELMRLVEEVAFQRLDRRLAMLLVRESEQQRRPTIPLTHQELAERLGTSREIVSRILGSFELQGLVELGRRQIQLLDPRALLEIASPSQG